MDLSRIFEQKSSKSGVPDCDLNFQIVCKTWIYLFYVVSTLLSASQHTPL